ncbi:hypothetical protein [Gramella sp. KN1008]|uniref:hypothetical protein n=1 Tax=Gramella sp. KN1008 TaxID=2529298 RepID=UPI00103CB5BE|nr:hypothetical protein [Gramella sp. KN1008]TBW30156.1 hypothetical protein EZJ28_01775 [Gramella sp. KN1008]
MERSIENIWKEDFDSEKSFKVPVVRNLYDRKSKMLIERIRSTSKKDNISLIPIAVVFAVGFILMGQFILGIYFGMIFMLLFFLNRRKLRQLDELRVTSNTYKYIVGYYSQLKNMQRYYTWLLGIGLPILILPACWMYFKDTPIWISFLEFEVSVQLLILVLAAISLSGLGILSYRLSTHILYSSLFTRLKGIISDMEDLAGNSRS